MAVVALLAGMALCATPPAAAEQKGDERVVVLVERVQDLHLTDEQEARIAAIRKDYQPKVREEAKALAALVKDEVDKVRAVLTAEQKAKLAELKEDRKEMRAERLAERIAHLEALDLTDAEVAKITEIRKECRPKIEKAMKGLEGVLSDAQKKAREDGLKANMKRKEIIASLKLTDDQKSKVEAICKEVHTLVREELEKMREVLTEGQRAKLDELKSERKEHVRDHLAHRIANLKELNLTEEQKTKIADIRKEFRPKVHEAGSKLRATVREEVEAILGVLKG
jgi:Spy/CpxP family protein refolding chaperone